ncbi:MAG: spermidine/putrescine ABC transporter substrate-binding protein [Thermoplasmata archaeon]|nr:MAG: spermidine/putrescine ABC transporter substrate-binding protein [Thermoplasmata archaeon]
MRGKFNLTIVCLVILISSLFSGCFISHSPKQGLSEELNIFNWEDYFGETTLEDFEEIFGVKVNLYTFEEEDYMISALSTNPGKYDVVIASDTVVKQLIEMKLLAKLNKSNIPNIKYLDPNFLNLSFDPGNNYSIPYLWGTTGIAYNISVVEDDVKSWSILWNTNYSGRIILLDNKDEVIATALKYLGYSINTRNLSQLKEAEALLLRQKPLIQGYEDPITIIDKLVSGDAYIAHCYSGDAYAAADKNANITYVIPEEGSPIWIDNLIIPVDSSHKYTAEVFINYILKPKVIANITNYQWYANPNTAAEKYVNKSILEEPGIYPPQDILEKCEYFKTLDADTYSEHNRIWAELHG